MTEEASKIVKIHDDFYRDSFGKVIFAIASIVIALAVIVCISVYLYITKPTPVIFPTDKDWRILPPVPVDQAYLTQGDLLQWVGSTLPKVFVFDFNNYNSQLATYKQYFTDDGWKVFLNQLNIYVNYTNVQNGKLFVSAAPGLAPYIVKEGMMTGRHAWWIQMPVDINFTNQQRKWTQTITLQVLVVRIPTVENLTGVAIDNVVVLGSQGAPVTQGSQVSGGV